MIFPRRPKTQGMKIYGDGKEAPSTEGEGGRRSLLWVERGGLGLLREGDPASVLGRAVHLAN